MTGEALKLPLGSFQAIGAFAACLCQAAKESGAAFVQAYARTLSSLSADAHKDSEGGHAGEQQKSSSDNGEADSDEEQRPTSAEANAQLPVYPTSAEANVQLPVYPTSTEEKSGEEDEQSEHDKIEKQYVGIRLIPIGQLKEPGKMFQVRPVKDNRVKELTREFLEKGQRSLTSHLTVLKEEGDSLSYVVVDGNHRLKAMNYIRDHEGKTERFATIPCRVYAKLQIMQALSLGFSCNREASDVCRMTDYDVVSNLRKIIGQMNSDNTEMFLAKVYDLLNATSVSKLLL